MSNISDIIEAFLLDTLGDENTLSISRNQLASYFAVAPSQINYVLSTRFTPAKGYVVQSRRGGGGFITVVRLTESPSTVAEEILSRPANEGYSYRTACQILERLIRDGLLTEREGVLVSAALSDKALLAPTVMQKDVLRASILKAVVSEALKQEPNRQ